MIGFFSLLLFCFTAYSACHESFLITPEEIRVMPFERLRRTPMTDFSPEQINALPPELITNLPFERIQELSIKDFSPEQISALSLGQTRMIPRDKIRLLPYELVRALSIDQLKNLGDWQLRVFPFEHLSPEQINALNSVWRDARISEQIESITRQGIKYYEW
ncbi:MAG: hypothetical protein OXB86_01420 [Bdellovibrionales bacterium]|nr:hypothetical protein [Bdellovibrionales bacterium]